MSQAKKIACRASLALLLAMFWLPGRVEHSAPARLAPLSLAFIDSTSPEARISLKKYLDDLDGVIGEWLNVDSNGKVSEEEDPDKTMAVRPRQSISFAQDGHCGLGARLGRTG